MLYGENFDDDTKFLFDFPYAGLCSMTRLAWGMLSLLLLLVLLSLPLCCRRRRRCSYCCIHSAYLITTTTIGCPATTA